MPSAAPTMFCSAMKHSTKRSRELVLELVGEGGVLDLGVERDDARVRRCPGAPAPRRTPRARPTSSPSLYGGRRRRAPAARGRRGRPRRGCGPRRSATAADRRPRPAPSELLPFLSGLPCQPSLPSTTLAPLPLRVVPPAPSGRRRLARASSNALLSAATSWPSTADGVPAERAPLAADRLHAWSCMVGPLCPSPLTLTMAHTLASFSYAADLAASHTAPSAISPSPMRQ